MRQLPWERERGEVNHQKKEKKKKKITKRTWFEINVGGEH